MMAYYRMHAAMQPSSSDTASPGHPAQRIRFERDDKCTTIGFIGTEFELYAAFDALVLRREALEICQKLAAWVKANQSLLFCPV